MTLAPSPSTVGNRWPISLFNISLGIEEPLLLLLNHRDLGVDQDVEVRAQRRFAPPAEEEVEDRDPRDDRHSDGRLVAELPLESAHQDRSAIGDGHGRDNDGDFHHGGAGDVGSGAANGASGFRFLGTIVGALAHSRIVTSGFGFYGAGMSVYSHFLARGRDVVYPKDMSMMIGLGTREKQPVAGALPATNPK